MQDGKTKGLILLVCSADSPAAAASVRNLEWIISAAQPHKLAQVLNVGPVNHGVLGFLKAQLYVTLYVAIHRTLISQTIFFVGVSLFVLPILSCALIKKPVVLIAPGSATLSTQEIYGEGGAVAGSILTVCAKIFEQLGYLFCSRLVTEAPSIANELNLHRYGGKLWTTGTLGVDTTTFKLTRRFADRGPIVAFCGRFSSEKGVLQFVKALPGIAEKLDEVEFHIIGEGKLEGAVRMLVLDLGLQDRVKISSWLSKADLAAYLNTIRILVVPSLTEGLPLTMLEAMASGVVVVATKVGGLPSVIADGHDGFLLPTGNPDDISRGVVSALLRQDVSAISENAAKKIPLAFSLTLAVKRYADILS